MTLPALGTTPDARNTAERVNRLIREFNRGDRKAPIVGTDTGTATAYVIDPAPGIALYEVGQSFVFTPANANSGAAPTLDVNGKGAGPIAWPDGTALAAGDIRAGASTEVVVATTAPAFHLKTSSTPGIQTALLTTRGDIIRRGASAPERLALGAAGLALVSDGTDALWARPTLQAITASLDANVALNNTANYFDGPQVTQGPAGVWFVSGAVTVTDTAGVARIDARLWDGTTVIASTVSRINSAGTFATISLFGFIANPAGNLRISARDVTSTSGSIQFNASGNSMDSTITAFRIG